MRMPTLLAALTSSAVPAVCTCAFVARAPHFLLPGSASAKVARATPLRKLSRSQWTSPCDRKVYLPIPFGTP
eukprot:7231316-Alexandrium_andersonii.AAC.1